MKVILFDGVCNLCNGLVNWVIDRDKNKRFKFASLQSDYGKEVTEKCGLNRQYMDSVVLVDEEKFYMRSDAVLRMLKYLDGIYPVLYFLIIIPAFIRNFFYNIVARNRYRWFGKSDVCRVATPELKDRFIA